MQNPAWGCGIPPVNEIELVEWIVKRYGRERVLAAYEEALRGGYRFLSYGDAMLIV